MHCYECGNDFIENPTFPQEEGYAKLCCLCSWPDLMTYSGEECVMAALWNEIEELLDGVEGDFERIIPMEKASEVECNYTFPITDCGPECAYSETCPWNDVYTLPGS